MDGFGEEDRTPKVPLETQLATLEPYQPVEGEDLSAYGEVSKSQAEVYQQIFMQARRLNYNISDLEVVLVGQRNQGKSSLLQAVLGVPLALGRTRRAFHFHLVNAPSATSPRYILKENFKETVVSLEQLQAELTKRNRARTDTLTVLVEYKWGFDMTIVDTPAIRSLEDLAVWARPAMTGTSNRFLVVVEAAKPVKDIQALQWLKHFDPSYSRSMLVLTGLDRFLSSFQANPRNALFHFGDLSDAPCFWTTLPSAEISKDCGLDDSKFKLRVWQHAKRDLESLRLLGLDYAALQPKTGIFNFRKYLDTLFQTDLHRHIPALTRAFEHSIAKGERKLSISNDAITAWHIDNIRSQATTYTTLWLRHMDALIKGSVSGAPSKNGQTLEEEILDFARWDNAAPISFEGAIEASITNAVTPYDSVPSATRSKVPNANLKLYGAPQLLRLLEEFKITASTLEMPAIDSNELIGSVDSAWAASEIARRKVELQFIPLLGHLMSRAFYIMRKIVPICDQVTEQHRTTASTTAAAGKEDDSELSLSPRSSGSSHNNKVSQKSFPAFSTFLRQSYMAAQAEAQRLCLSKSKDEFCSSLTIYWELTGGIDPVDMTKNPSERLQHVETVAKGIYAKVKERLIEAFLLNVQTYFLTPAAILKLSKSVAANVATLGDASIKDMFLIDQIKAGHQADIRSTTTDMTSVKEMQGTFLLKLVPALKN